MRGEVALKKQGMCTLKFVVSPYGSYHELEDKETADYIIAESVKLVFLNERIYPTQFDEHGNPQIGGIANLILTWKIRQRVREGVFHSEHSSEVMYSYETSGDQPIVVPFVKRLQPENICPICGKEITVFDLNELEEHVELLEGGATNKRYKSRVEKICEYGFSAIVHTACAREFRHLKMIDDMATTIFLAFGSIDFAKENRWDWGKGENQMWYELLPSGDYTVRQQPWLLLHTPVGNMQIGWKDQNINVTFLPDFAVFDMAIFIEDNIIKHFGVNGVRIIYADSLEKMHGYLVKVHKAIYDT